MDKYPHDGKGAPPPYAAASSRHSGPRRRHVSPIDAAKHVGRKEKRKDLFRCRINDDVLFQVPDPQHSGSSRIHDSHPDPSLEVHASTLECLIAAARSCSYFAAQRLYPDEKVIAHQIVKRETGFGIGPYETDATEATIQLLTEALKRYEEDPAILWSLWMHQSVSFGWESATVLRKLEEWSNAFPPSRQAGGVWDEATVEAKMAAARKRLRPRAKLIGWAALVWGFARDIMVSYLLPDRVKRAGAAVVEYTHGGGGQDEESEHGNPGGDLYVHDPLLVASSQGLAESRFAKNGLLIAAGVLAVSAVVLPSIFKVPSGALNNVAASISAALMVWVFQTIHGPTDRVARTRTIFNVSGHFHAMIMPSTNNSIDSGSSKSNGIQPTLTPDWVQDMVMLVGEGMKAGARGVKAAAERGLAAARAGDEGARMMRVYTITVPMGMVYLALIPASLIFKPDGWLITKEGKQAMVSAGMAIVLSAPAVVFSGRPYPTKRALTAKATGFSDALCEVAGCGLCFLARPWQPQRGGVPQLLGAACAKTLPTITIAFFPVLTITITITITIHHRRHNHHLHPIARPAIATRPQHRHSSSLPLILSTRPFARRSLPRSAVAPSLRRVRQWQDPHACRLLPPAADVTPQQHRSCRRSSRAMDPASLKVTELKAELKKRGLAVGGLKKELIERLTEALERENAAEEPEEEEEEVEAEAEAEESPATVENATPNDKMEDVRVDESKEADTSSSTLAAEQSTERAEDVEMTAPEEKPAPEPAVEPAVPTEPPAEEASEPEQAPQAAAVETAEPTPTPNKETPKQSDAVLEPITTAPTPLQTPEVIQSIEADHSNRRKRSRSPSVRTEEVDAKKARVQEVLPGRDEESMTDAAPAISTDSPERERGRASPQRERSTSRSRDRSRSRSRGSDRRSRSRSRSRTRSPSQPRQRPSITASTKDARFKSLFNKQDSAAAVAHPTTAVITGAASPSRSDDDDIVSPSIHPATRALYIRELVRPLQESQLKAHLVQLASSRASSESASADDSILEMIYLDGIKTHCFAIFASVQACSRARNGVHGKLFPNEKNRKVLFADYVPEEKVAAWIAREKQNRGVRYVVTYGDSDDGVEAIHEEYSGMGNAGYGPNNSGSGPRGSVSGMSERSRAPIDAPSGPRGRGTTGTGTNAAPAARVVSLDELFLCTKTKPKIYYKPVDEATVKERIAKGPVEGEVRGRPARKPSSDSWRGGFGRGGRGGGGPGGPRRVGGDSWTSRDRDREFERRDWVRDGGRGDRRGPYRERSPAGRW
ncbi:hypothetical protein Dda_7262 [Drechslerella dactyloides]|uniref:SAP domain-containing protein n=1 Tax=Drechslerella dactyloides TaxID=74499 RepID=A0AAD6IS93_DREDA|nr:hypothetical protein Dda_7262 [Drechslerella dactyloides]